MLFKSPAIAYILVLVVLTLLSFSGSGSSDSDGVSSCLAFAAPIPVPIDVAVSVDERDAPYHAPHRLPGCNANPYLRGCNYPVHSPQYPPKNKGKGKPPALDGEKEEMASAMVEVKDAAAAPQTVAATVIESIEARHRHNACNDVPWERDCQITKHTPTYPPKDKPAPKFNYPPKKKGKGKPPVLEEEEVKEKDVAQTSVEATVEKKDVAQTTVENKREYLAPPRHNDCDKVPWEHMCKNAKHHPMDKPKHEHKPKGKKKPPADEREELEHVPQTIADVAAGEVTIGAVDEAALTDREDD